MIVVGATVVPEDVSRMKGCGWSMVFLEQDREVVSRNKAALACGYDFVGVVYLLVEDRGVVSRKKAALACLI